LESGIRHPSFQLHKLITRYVTHISDELIPKTGVGYGQIGTYVRVHELSITHYTKYITYFEESLLLNVSHTVLYNAITLKA